MYLTTTEYACLWVSISLVHVHQIENDICLTWLYYHLECKTIIIYFITIFSNMIIKQSLCTQVSFYFFVKQTQWYTSLREEINIIGYVKENKKKESVSCKGVLKATYPLFNGSFLIWVLLLSINKEGIEDTNYMCL